MKILILVGKFPQLSETFIFRKVVALAERGHTVTVAARDPGDWSLYKNELPFPDNIRVIYLTPDSRLKSFSRILRVFKNIVFTSCLHPIKTYNLLRWIQSRSKGIRNQVKLFLRYLSFIDTDVDIIHFEFLQMPVMYSLLPKLLGKPFVVSARGSDINRFKTYSFQQQEQLLHVIHNANAIHTVSSKIAATIEKVSGRTRFVWVNRAAVSIDYAFIDKELISDPIILAVGRLVWIKGFDYFFAALKLLKERNLKFKVKILGEGELEYVLRFSIYDLGLTDCVELVGSVAPSEVKQYMRQAQVFVLSSHEEGISNAVLEAMSAGLPIVTTDAGGMSEAVRDGINGFVVPIRDVNALAEKIELLLTDGQLRERLGRAGRRCIEREFTLDRQAKVFEGIYKSVLEQQSHKGVHHKVIL